MREHEEVPEAALDQLATQRVEAVRDALATKEGIPAGRLLAGTPTTATSGDGRVEFRIVQ